MDKLKTYLAVLRKYQFWVTCGLMLVVAIACWWVATASLAAKFKDQKTKLDSTFKEAAIGPNHPNEKVVKTIKDLDDRLKRNVYTAWEILYNEQKEKNGLPTVLGDDFQERFKNLKPKEDLEYKYRARYQTYILKEYVPSLKQKIDARRPAEEKKDAATTTTGATNGTAGVGGGGRADRRPGLGGMMMPGMTPGAMQSGNSAEADWIGIVDWNDANYKTLEARFDWQQAPSTFAILLAQEDLWVYEALLRVIKNCNEGATSYLTAPVKRIDALEIGSAAARAWKESEQSILRGQSSTGAPGPGGPGPGGPGFGGLGVTMPQMGPPGGFGREGMTAAGGDQEIRQLMENRYVDDKGQPLPYESEYPHAKQPYAEFKMMPIRMSLLMDQRRLTKLLAECANSNMPIEVRRVRILGSQGGTLDLAAAAAPPGGAMPGGMPGPSMGMPPSGRAGGNRSGNETSEAAGSYDVPLEIQGVIYIYEPPNREKLGTGAAADKPTETASPATPLTTPPPTSPGPPAGGPPPAPQGTPKP